MKALDFSKCDEKFRIYRDKYPKRERIKRPKLYIKKLTGNLIMLPEPEQPIKSPPIFDVLFKRRSIRSYSTEPIDTRELSTLLFYSLGVSKLETGYGEIIPLRTFPTAGALNSIEAYLVINNIKDVEEGIYYYNYMEHALELIDKGDFADEMYKITLEQTHAREAAVNVILVGFFDRNYWKYGERAYKYVHLDAGHASQNILLVAQAMEMGACVIGAFYDEELCELLKLDCQWKIPLLVVTIGKIKLGIAIRKPKATKKLF